MPDIVICVGPKDTLVAKRCVESCKQIAHDTIQLIAKEDPRIEDTVFIAEDTFPFSFETVSQKLKTKKRAGWQLQQLLKLQAHRILALGDYVLVDADVVFQKPIQFFENERICFNVGTEYHKPQFAHMQKVHPSLKRLCPKESGITHCMPLRKAWTEGFLAAVEHLHGKPFYEVFLDCVDLKQRESSGASEQEMLFSWQMQNHDCIVKKLSWKNVSKISPNDCDQVACHWYMRA